MNWSVNFLPSKESLKFIRRTSWPVLALGVVFGTPLISAISFILGLANCIFTTVQCTGKLRRFFGGDRKVFSPRIEEGYRNGEVGKQGLIMTMACISAIAYLLWILLYMGPPPLQVALLLFCCVNYVLALRSKDPWKESDEG